MTRSDTPPYDSRPRLRRAHRKSRKGCRECKKRHIKCDERRPQCANCVTADRLCSFPEPSYSPNPLAPSTLPATIKIEQLETQSPGNGAHFTAIHMALLHYAESHMEEYMALQGSVQPIIDIAINNALVAPYLLDQLLALSALHLATTDASTEPLYSYEATELQTRALELFNQARKDTSDTNCIAMFLFASFLGIHILKETLCKHRDSLCDFVDSFMHYVHLHRGVRAVLANGSWAVILQSDLKPLLSVASFSDDVEAQPTHSEILELSNFLESSGSGTWSISACQNALKWIQRVLNTSRLHPSRRDLGTHATMAWPLLVSQEYIEALQQRRPEAIVVLAYYATALHRFRRYWVFGGAGSSLIRLISSNLDSTWDNYMAWPARVLSEG
ncbi:Upc2 protein [Lojkania enalia]|uniref:Upc2 protein n=1 Tax=Lojkania enalia TaxID=147567 RepID=A0A9P4N3Y4_9PLEO|nr:Upc2 protein [Didymosphaeria enalia]